MANNTLNNRVLDTINNINNGAVGVVVEMMTIPTWASKKNPYFGRVVKHSRIANIALGLCYTNVVESHSDNKEEPYIPNAPKGMHYPTNEKGKITTYKYLISDKDTNQLYLNLIYRGNESVTKEYILDGQVVTDSAVVADIESYIRTSSYCKKQLEHGVSQKKIVLVNRPMFQNVTLITHGERVVYRRDEKEYRIAL